MVTGEIRLTREELYELVWRTPVHALARDYGLSDVGLAKICDRLGVPRPGRGHWARIAQGHDCPRPPLPRRGADVRESVVLGKRRAPASAAGNPRPIVIVGHALAKPHVAVTQLRDALRRSKVDDYGMLTLRGDWHGSVLRVSPELHERALRILDALLKALVARGYAVDLELPRSAPRDYYRLKIVAGPEAIDVMLSERAQQIPYEPTPGEQRQKSVRGFAPVPLYRPTHRLTLQLHALFDALPRRSWSDGERRPLEGALGDIVVAVDRAFAAIRHRRDAEAAQERAREEQQRHRDWEERRASHRKDLVEHIVRTAADWSRAESIRGFLRAAAAAIPVDERDAQLTTWLAWAAGCADAIDPLRKGEPLARALEPPSDE
jgi:hypothetical protein